MLKKFLLSPLLLPVVASSLYAEDQQLDTVIVSASKIEQKPEHVGSSVTVLTRETLEKRGDRTVVDALARVPSVSFSRSGGIGGQTNLRMRGATQGKTLVLIDGIRVSDSSTINNEFDFSTLMVNDIERIEVLRGNQSALYGADAIGGVINITTIKRVNGVAGSAFLEGGSFGTAHGGASVRGGTDKVTFGLSANHFRNDGFSRRNTIKKMMAARLAKLEEILALILQTVFSVSINGGYELAEFDLDGGFSSSPLGSADRELYYGQVQATYYALDDRLKNNVFYRVSHTDRDSNTPGYISEFLGTTQTVGYQGDIELLDRDVLTFGVDHRHEKYESEENLSAFNTFKVNNTAYFLNYVKGLGDDVTLTLGGRIDDHEQFGTQETYRSTVAYNIPETDTKFHGSYGTGFKAPSLYQLFGSFVGNENLQAEETVGWDLGVTQSSWNNRITTDITYFKNDLENMISYSGGYVNVGKAKVEGVEIALDVQATDNFSFFGNYTLTSSKDKSTGLSLERTPRHIFNLGTDFSYDKFSFGLLGRYVGTQIDSGTTNNEPFFTADANVSYAMNDQLSLYARVDNIFDHDYQEVLTYNTPGVSAYGGIRITY